MSVIIRYFLLQIPGWILIVLLLILLRRLFVYPIWLLWCFSGLWIIKDIALFPFLWKSYASPSPSKHSMIGKRGITKERLDPVGFIQVSGELWKAEKLHTCSPINSGIIIEIIDIKGLKLFVSPCTDLKNKHPH